MRLIADKAHANDTAAVALMRDLGFDARVTGPDNTDALHWAAFQGNADMVRLLLRRDPPIGVREGSYGGTPLDWCVYGAVQGWAKDRGDFATTAQLLLDAGERPDSADLPTGCQRALADLMVVHRPARPMLHPLVAGGEEIAVKARHIVALLNQLELHIT